MDRSTGGFLLALAGLVPVLVVIFSRLASRRTDASTPPTVAVAESDDDASCAFDGCSATATRARPELRPSRPLSLMLPRWAVVTDPEGEPLLCGTHHGVVAAALTARAAAETAATEEHLSQRHAELARWSSQTLPRSLGLRGAKT